MCRYENAESLSEISSLVLNGVVFLLCINSNTQDLNLVIAEYFTSAPTKPNSNNFKADLKPIMLD